MQVVLTPAIKLRVFWSFGGLQVRTFGSVSFILTLASKWGCDTLLDYKKRSMSPLTLRIFLHNYNCFLLDPYPFFADFCGLDLVSS